MSFADFLAKNELSFVRVLSKGWTSFVYLVADKRGKLFAAKVLREKSNRREMVFRESENLRKANEVGVGPKLAKADFVNNVVLMEFVDGLHFSDWLFSNPSKEVSESVIFDLCRQAELLDSVGLDHGQLAGRGKNIIVRDKEVVIIDFEKASQNRKVHNKLVVDSFLFRNKNSSIARKVKELGIDLLI